MSTATDFMYRSVTLSQIRSSVRGHCETRTEYLEALKLLSTIHDWKRIQIGVLHSEVDGNGSNWTAQSSADGQGLQTHVVGSDTEARRTAIATLRAWVVRNIQDEASIAKKESMEPGPAEQRALELLRSVDGNKLVRYRGGSWCREGLKMVEPGPLPEPAPSASIAILRKLAQKKLVVLDETKGEATLIPWRWH